MIHRGFFISGKFDQLRNNPYGALIIALEGLMRSLLTLNQKDLARWKENILEAVGENGQVLIDLVPTLEAVIGPQEKASVLDGEKNENRLKYIFRKFISLFAKKEHPLTIFLDDLQWADLASLNLIKTMAIEMDNSCLLFIGTYRDNEVTPAHPLMLTLKEIKEKHIEINSIKLAPLSKEDMNALIADSLECPMEKTIEFSELVYSKTKGNPFFTGELLKNLYINGILYPGQLGWEWNIKKMEAIEVADNVVELLTGKIEKLPAKNQDILKVAACIGNRFELKVLITLFEKPREEIMRLMASIMEEGFVFLKEEIYYFSHDRVLEAVYSLIPGTLKKELHYKIGSLMLQNSNEEELEKKLFYITNHLNDAADLIKGEEKEFLAGLNLRGGKKAKQRAAYERALHYFQEGLKLLKTNCWDSQYNLALTLYNEAAEAALLSTRFPLMEEFIEVVLKNAKDLRDTVGAYRIRIKAFNAQSNYIRAIEVGREIKNKLGEYIPVKCTKLTVLGEVIKTKKVLRGKSMEDLYNLPWMEQPYPDHYLSRTVNISLPAYFCDKNLYIVLTFSMLIYIILNGRNPYYPVCLITYSTFLCSILRDIPSGSEFGKLAIRIVRDHNMKETITTVFNLYYGYVFYWTGHLKKALHQLVEGYKTGLEMGDVEMACFNIANYCYGLVVTEKNLMQSFDELGSYMAAVDKLKQVPVYLALENCRKVTGVLTGNVEYSLKALICDDEIYTRYLKLGAETAIFFGIFSDTYVCYLFSYYDRALEFAEISEKYSPAATGHFYVPLQNFYHSLILLAVCREKKDKKAQTKILKKVKANQKKLKEWSRLAPMNYKHKYELVEAETARSKGDIKRALFYYEAAINHSGENEYINDKALALECAAKFYIEQGNSRVGTYYMEQSHYYYTRWGATAMAARLEKKYSDFFTVNNKAAIDFNTSFTKL